jgi:hypothetical protein
MHPATNYAQSAIAAANRLLNPSARRAEILRQAQAAIAAASTADNCDPGDVGQVLAAARNALRGAR